MFVKELEKEEVKEFVKLLFECCDELGRIFGDEYIGMEIMREFYEKNPEGVLIVKGERIFGFAVLKTSEGKGYPLKPFLILGLSRGLKARMLLSFFDRKPKKDEVYVRFIGVHPKLNVYEVGGVLVDSVIEYARRLGKRRISVWLPVESDFVDLFLERGFEIKRMLESSFAKKHFGRKYYYLLNRKC